MKKTIFTSLALIVALTACNNETLLTDEMGKKADSTLLDDTKSIVIPDVQNADKVLFADDTNKELYLSVTGGIRLNFKMSGITHVELESVDGYTLAGTAKIDHENGKDSISEITDRQSIITLYAPSGSTFEPEKDYYITTFPCDLSGGYRLSIYKDGLVAHYFDIHQEVEAGAYISPNDLVESELVFDDPNAPLIEEVRPELDQKTKDALIEYQKNPTKENKDILLEQMGIRYDKVVARKKAKLRELEREAKQQSLVDEMQDIVNEMVENRDIRLEQQFLRLIDSREDDNPNDEWMVLRGASAKNAYIAYAPVTNAEYASYNKNYTYGSGKERFPVVNITYTECVAYCEWLSSLDTKHSYRMPTEEEWMLAAGHMPKDVIINSDHVEAGLTAIDAYAQTTGACGGIDFWGNCWEWTSTQNTLGLYIIKGGSWDSSRDACRSEYSDDARESSKAYPNVGFRVVRVEL